MADDKISRSRNNPEAPDLTSLTAFMQPIMDLSSGQIVGFEALARFRDDQSLLSPAHFLSNLSESEKIDLFSRMFRLAYQFIQHVRQTYPTLYVSVNVESSVLLSAGFCDLVSGSLGGEVASRSVYLELLESEQMTDFEGAQAILSRLQSLGVGISLDDVGSAYSSLLMLKRLPIDTIKLDQAFARELPARPEDLQFVYSMVLLARGLGMRLIVEGIETPEIQDALTIVGVELGQGYGIAKPMPMECVEDWLLGHVAVGRSSLPNSLLGCYAAHLNVVETCRALAKQPVPIEWREDARNPHLCSIGKYFDTAQIHETGYGQAHKKFHAVIDQYQAHRTVWEKAANQFCCELKKAILICEVVGDGNLPLVGVPQASSTLQVENSSDQRNLPGAGHSASTLRHRSASRETEAEAQFTADNVFFQIAEAADDVFILTTADLDPPGPTIVYVNPAFTRLTGYRASEAAGRSPRLMQGPGTDRATLASLGSALRSGREVREKVLNYHKDGSPYWLDLRIVPLRDGKGVITHFAAVERDVTEDKRRLDALEVVADRDPLTGVANRRAFTRIAKTQMAAAEMRERSGSSVKGFCLAFIDVDRFKYINDTFGHATGDAVLLGLADRLTENVRRSDLVGRMGGDEFAVWMPALSLDEARGFAGRLYRAVAEDRFEGPTGPVSITVSIGVAALISGDDFEGLMARADEEMYSSKQGGHASLKLPLN